MIAHYRNFNAPKICKITVSYEKDGQSFCLFVFWRCCLNSLLFFLHFREHIMSSPFFSKRNAFRMMGGWVAIVSKTMNSLKLHPTLARSPPPCSCTAFCTSQHHTRTGPRTLPEVQLIHSSAPPVTANDLRYEPSLQPQAAHAWMLMTCVLCARPIFHDCIDCTLDEMLSYA